jgi:hypothetical protein
MIRKAAKLENCAFAAAERVGVTVGQDNAHYPSPASQQR